MGREIRRVPPNWEHPRKNDGNGAYQPMFDNSATEELEGWLQVYETVSEGTPVTPPFETPEELVDYLVENGDFWDQRRRSEGGCSFMNCDPWPREIAERFVNAGWAPSLVTTPEKVNIALNQFVSGHSQEVK